MGAKTSFFIVGLVVGLLIATGGFSILLKQRNESETVSDKLVLKLGHSLNPTHPVHKGMEVMKEQLEELSGGSMTIDIYASGVLGSEVQCLEQLQNGSLAMTKTSTAAMESFIPEMAVFSLPYVFRDHDHFWRVLNSPLGMELLQAGEEKFLRGLCYYDSGSRNFYTIDKQIKTPEDLVGMKIRVMNSPASMELIEALGGAPTPINWGELYTALAQGMVDGAENNPPSYYTNKHFEVAKYFTYDEHSRIPDILLISTKIWGKMTMQQQLWLQEAADISSEFQRELWAKQTKEDLDAAVEEGGVVVYYPDQSLFREKCMPLLEKYDDTKIGEILDKIDKVK